MNTSSKDKKITVVVTGGDYYLGNEFARRLLVKRDEFARLSVTMTKPERGKDLQRAGAEIKEINYKDENSLVSAFGGEVDWVLLVADPEEATRVEDTKKLIDATQKAGKVKNVLFVSSIGAESQDKESLKEFKELEDYVKQKGKNWVVVRMSWVVNFFYLWSIQVIENGKFPLHIQAMQKFTPIQLKDVNSAIHAIFQSDDENHNKHIGKTYTLTGPKEVDGPQLVKALNDAVGNGQVEFMSVKREELEQYLKSLRHRDDDRLKRRFEGQPTDKQVETILDLLEWVASGNTHPTDDLEKLTGKKGEHPEQFFKEHSAEFGGRDGGNKESSFLL